MECEKNENTFLKSFYLADTDYIPSSSSTTTTPATPANLMAQSMPPSLLEATTGNAEKSVANGSGNGNGEVVDALSRTCNNLQRQIEMLQSSLSGVMSFMSAFTSFDSQQQLIMGPML